MIRSKQLLIALAGVVLVGFSISALAAGTCGGMTAGDKSCKTEPVSKDKKAAAKVQKQECVSQSLTSKEAKVGDTVCCPVMGTRFTVTEKSLFAEVNGKKVYVCCPGCIAPLKAEPEKYLKKS